MYFFDNISFKTPLTIDDHINLADTSIPTEIQISRNSIRVPKNTLRVFTTNDIELLFTGIDLESEKAAKVLSKYLFINIQNSLFKDDEATNRLRDQFKKKICDHNLEVLHQIQKRENKSTLTVTMRPVSYSL